MASLFWIVFLSLVTYSLTGPEYKRICYYTNWTQYREGAGKFVPEDINPDICTHIVFAFAYMEGNSLTTLEWNDEDMYARVNMLKYKNPSLRTLLAVGGWNFDLDLMTSMLSTPSNRGEFCRTSMEFLRERNFDGLDLDFEYPGNRESPPEDKHRFSQLVQMIRLETIADWGETAVSWTGRKSPPYECRRIFDDEPRMSGEPPLLLTAAVGVGKQIVDAAYEIDQISQHLDFISLMSYDIHGAWDVVVGHNSPLHSRSGETGEQLYNNVEKIAEYWVKGGCPSEKLIIGMPTFGRGFVLADPNTHDLGAPATGPSAPGNYTKEEGYMAYYEMCSKLKSGATRYWSDEQKVPYAVYNGEWFGYDDVESLTGKVTWLKSEGYGGWMSWSLDMDDFSGVFCDKGWYPLHQAMKDTLDDDEPWCTSSVLVFGSNTGGLMLLLAMGWLATNMP